MARLRKAKKSGSATVSPLERGRICGAGSFIATKYRLSSSQHENSIFQLADLSIV